MLIVFLSHIIRYAIIEMQMRQYCSILIISIIFPSKQGISSYHYQLIVKHLQLTNENDCIQCNVELINSIKNKYETNITI